MPVRDITRPLPDDALVYPGDPVPRMVQEDTGASRISTLTLCSHSGTHIDAPSHFLEGGATVDAIPLERLMGRARVADLRSVRGTITAEHLEPHLAGTKRLLLKTWFSEATRFDPAYPALSLEAARLLTENGVFCVGIDTPSIEAYDGDGAVHRHLLAAGVAVIELLDLAGVPAGDYTMVALPLRLKGCDGSPARVVLSDAETTGGR